MLKPKLIVCLGATAAQAVFGKTIVIKKIRASFEPFKVENAIYQIFVTVHPSSILRAMDTDRAKQMKEFVSDLKKVRKFLDN